MKYHGFGSPTPPPKEFKWSTPRQQPATPVIVPPTPSPSGPVSVRPAEPSSSTQDVFYDAEDADLQMKRRSLYRSPGTSSSPDLATLLRKAKERGVSAGHYPNKRDKLVPDSPLLPPPLPKSFGRNTAGRTRLRSPTSIATSPPAGLVTPVKGKPATCDANEVDCLSVDISNPATGSEWVLASPLSRPPKENRAVTKVRHFFSALCLWP